MLSLANWCVLTGEGVLVMEGEGSKEREIFMYILAGWCSIVDCPVYGI